MQHCDTLIAPRWCIPVEPAGVVLTGHAIIVMDGRITDLLPLEKALENYQPSVLVERPDHVLIPGFVNTHTHAAMSLLRGLTNDLELHVWLKEHIWPAEQRYVGPEFVADGSLLAVTEMIRAGITCFNDMYFFP